MSVQTPQRSPASPARRLAGPLATLAAAGVSWAAVAVLRPSDAGASPCPWRSLTGLDCPLCGATRAASSLAHGDIVAALDHNAFFVVLLIPLSLVAWQVWAVRAWRGQPAPVPATWALQVLLGVTLAWWGLRLVVPWLGSPAG